MRTKSIGKRLTFVECVDEPIYLPDRKIMEVFYQVAN